MKGNGLGRGLLLLDLEGAWALLELVLALRGGEDHAVAIRGIGAEDEAGAFAADGAFFIHRRTCLDKASESEHERNGEEQCFHRGKVLTMAKFEGQLRFGQ